MELNITITPTAVGNKEYIQIMSDDSVTVNIVLVVDKITVKDTRTQPMDVDHE